ncbi:MAG: adenylate/guanylate cyclase domain-containing protein, partial [Bacillota bacterium]
DSYMTSFSRYGYHSGVEINSFALSNYLNNNYIVKSTRLLNFFILLVIFIFLLYGFKLIQINTDLKYLNNFKFSFMIAITYIIIHLTLFYQLNYYLDFFVPLFLITMIYLIDFSFRYFQQEKEITFIKNIFSRYVSEEIIEELLNNPEKLKLGGEKKKIAILFVDIRSFSEYSKQVSSKKAVEDLNYTFNKLTKIIIENNGTIDKYLGDGLLAFFGAPIKKEDFLSEAFTAALEIQILSLENKIPFQLGIGLNYGEVIVGNIGSEEKLDYTIIGNAVNEASLYVEKALANEMILSNMILNKLDEKSREKVLDSENISIWEEMKNEKDYN